MSSVKALNHQSEHGRRLLLTALIVAPFLSAAGYYFFQRTLIPNPDSACYLDWCPIRTSIYPLFLRIAAGPLLLPLQLLLLSLAVSWASFYVYQVSRSLPLAALLCAALLANPYVWRLQASILSEALTTPLLIIMSGLLVGYLTRKCQWLVLTSSLLAGVLIATRPSNLPLIAISPMAVFLTPGHSRATKLQLAILCGAFSLTLVIADRLCTWAVHGREATSLLGRHTFAKSVLIDAPPVASRGLDPIESRLAILQQRDFRPIRSVLRSVARRPDIVDILQANYEACLQYTCTDEAVSDITTDRPKLDAALFRVGFARLRENPAAYLSLSVSEYRRLWLLDPRKDPALAREFNSYLRSVGSLPLQEQLGASAQPVPSSEPFRLQSFLRGGFIVLGYAVGLLTLVLGMLRVHRATPPLVTAAFIFLTATEAVLMLCALLGIGTPRYTMGMWPLIATAFVLLFNVVLDGTGRPMSMRIGHKEQS